MEYTAHETLPYEKDIPPRIEEIKKTLSRTHPNKEVTFDWYRLVDGNWTLSYTIIK